MNTRNQAIEQAAQILVDEEYSEVNATLCYVPLEIIDAVRIALTLPKDTTERDALIARILDRLSGWKVKETEALLTDIRNYLGEQ